MAKEFTEEQESSWEIITIQELKELYCDKKQLLEPNYKLYQMATLAGRMYFTVDDNMKFQRAYIGSTNIAKVMKMEDSLLRWWCKQGYEGAYKHMRERSVFGSFWHSEIASYSLSGKFSTKTLDERLTMAMRGNGIDTALLEEGRDGKRGWKQEIRMAMASYDAWVNEWEVEPIAIEIPVKSEIDGVATLIDWIGFANAKDYDKTPLDERKKQLTMVDFKSGVGGGFYKTHRFQLEACKTIFEENFPNMPQIQQLRNLSPKDFRGTQPTYSYVNQTDKCNQDEYLHYLELAKMKLSSMLNRKVRVMEGEMTFGAKNNLVVEMELGKILEDGIWQNYLLKNETI